ncbi:MAG: TrkA family potassium uptake protein [Pirellulales bacterium]
MNSSWRRIIIGGIFFGLTCLTAIGGYMAAGWHMLDAIYMVVITVFGVGYGETKPLDSPALKIFTMSVIVAGCSSAIYVVGGFVQMIAEGEINRVLGTRRMSKGIEQLKGHALVCGYGRVGQMLAHDLHAAEFPFVVIDANEERVQRAQAAGYLSVLGSASEEAILEAAGIARARVLAAVLPDDSANVFVTLTARELNHSIEIIARAELPSTEKKLRRSGATRVVMPALIGATKMANMIVRPSAEELLLDATGKSLLHEELRAIGLTMTEVDLPASSPLAGESVANIELGGGFVIVGIKKPDGSFLQHPSPETPLAAGDVVLILGHEEAVPQLARRARPQSMKYRGATV